MSKKSEKKKLSFDAKLRITQAAEREVLEEKVATMKAEMLAMKAAAAPVAAPAVALVPPVAAPTRAEVRANILQRAKAARDPLEQAQIILAGAFSLSSDEDQDREYALRGRPPPEAA